MRLTLHEPRKPNGTEELDQFEMARLAGEFTHADSVNWLQSLRPGVDVVWADAGTKSVEFSLTVQGAADSLRACVFWPYGFVREFTALRVDQRGTSRYRWDLKDDRGRVVKPGVYRVLFLRAHSGKEFVVVVDGGGMRE